jgi:hypothetical protein
MHWSAASYSSLFPMAPLGGLFVGCMGLFVLLGSVSRKARMTLTYIGFGAGTLALIIGGRLAIGLPRPTKFQVGALIVAIVLEVTAFVIVMPRARPQGERAVVVATLAIVGAHFIIMLPAFGPLVAALGVLCATNAAIALKRSSYSDGAAWFVDGALKFAFGSLLIATSPIFYRA